MEPAQSSSSQATPHAIYYDDDVISPSDHEMCRAGQLLLGSLFGWMMGIMARMLLDGGGWLMLGLSSGLATLAASGRFASLPPCPTVWLTPMLRRAMASIFASVAVSWLCTHFLFAHLLTTSSPYTPVCLLLTSLLSATAANVVINTSPSSPSHTTHILRRVLGYTHKGWSYARLADHGLEKC